MTEAATELRVAGVHWHRDSEVAKVTLRPVDGPRGPRTNFRFTNLNEPDLSGVHTEWHELPSTLYLRVPDYASDGRLDPSEKWT